MKVLILFILIHQILAVPKCCDNENIIVGKRCLRNQQPPNLNCTYKYIKHEDEEVFRIDSHENLVFSDETTVAADRYCMTHLNDTNHKTYIICFTEENFSQDQKFMVMASCLLISAIFLFLTVAIYCQLPDLLDLQGICILHSITSMAIAFTTLASMQFPGHKPPEICLTIAYLMYFCWLYSFFWFNTLSFHIWRTTVQPKIRINEKYWPYIYHIYAIALPILLLIFLIIVQHAPVESLKSIHPGLGETKCWFNSVEKTFIYFYGPMSVLLCLNIVFYTWTVFVLWNNIANFNEKNIKVHKYHLALCVKLLFIMGITWIFEVISAAVEDYNNIFNIIWFITDTLNTLQGFLIFLILVVFRKRVIRALANRTFFGKLLPNQWKTLQDDECDQEDIDEEFRLSERQKNEN